MSFTVFRINKALVYFILILRNMMKKEIYFILNSKI